MAQTVVIHKAKEIGTQKIESVNILISGCIPEFATLGETDHFAYMEACSIEAALLASLPGATYDRLTGLMLQRKATHFHVPHNVPIKSN